MNIVSMNLEGSPSHSPLNYFLPELKSQVCSEAGNCLVQKLRERFDIKSDTTLRIFRITYLSLIIGLFFSKSDQKFKKEYDLLTI